MKTISDMTPHRSVGNSSYDSGAHAKQGSDASLTHSLGKQDSNLCNFFRGEFCIGLFIPPGRITPTASNLIGSVFGMGSVKEMIRITARRIVTSVTAHIWPISIEQEERYPVCSLVLPATLEYAIAMPSDISQPGPARIFVGDKDLAPKTVGAAIIALLHRLTSFAGRLWGRSRSVTALPGISLFYLMGGAPSRL